MRRALVLVLVLALSGCAGNGPAATEPSAGPPTTPGGSTGTLRIEAGLPTWGVRQGWTYLVDVPGEPTRKFEMMVAEDRSDLWVVASNNKTQAFHHAVYSTNPVLGRIGKATLSPFQAGGPVDMYKFNLTDGKTWRAKFFDEEMTFTATYAGDIDVRAVNPARGLGKSIDGFRVQAVGTNQRVTYDFVEAVEWFTSFELVDKDGVRQIRLTLTDIETNYKGPYFFYRGKDGLVQTETVTAGAPAPKTLTAKVTDDFKDHVGLGLKYEGKDGTPSPRVNVTLKRPDASVAWSRDLMGVRLDDVLVDLTGAANQKTGDWTVELVSLGNVVLEVRVVGVKNFAEGSL